MTHTIVLQETTRDRRDFYGITHESAHVYAQARSSGPTRVAVWDNTGRPNKGGSHITGNGKYVDPQNVATDEPVSYLLTPESTVISADTRYSTGGALSRQAYGPGTLRDGDTATLAYPDGSTQDVTLHFPKHSNGHGYATVDH
jgi:hypothetical protein